MSNELLMVFLTKWFSEKTKQTAGEKVGLMELYDAFARDLLEERKQKISLNSFCQFLKIDSKKAGHFFWQDLSLKNPAENEEDEEEVGEDFLPVEDSEELREEINMVIKYFAKKTKKQIVTAGKGSA